MTRHFNPLEPHPAVRSARAFINSMPMDVQLGWLDGFDVVMSMQPEDTEAYKVAFMASETLKALIDGDPVPDLHVIGLAWMLKCIAEMDEGK